MAKRYGPSEFARLTGLSRSLIDRIKGTGELPGSIDSRGKCFYEVDDFMNPAISNRMKKNGDKLPDVVIAELTKTLPQKLKVVESPEPAKVLPFTSNKKVESLPSGLIKKYLKPLSNMNEDARGIWEFTLPDLISDESINKADLYILKNYCMIQSQITRMEIELDDSFFVEGRLSPLVAAVDKAKNTARSLAISLQITGLGRKGVKPHVKDSGDDAAWDKILNK